MKPFFLFLSLTLAATAQDFRLGIVGTDTSHVPFFTRVFNDASSKDHVPGFKVVAAYKGGSPDLKESYSRVDKYAEEISSKYGVEIVPDIKTLCSKVDGVLLESVDGRTHLRQAREVIAAHKPLFIDKPLASTLADAREIARLAKEANVKWFSTSSLRYYAAQLKTGDITGATTWGPGPLEEHHQLDLSWYAIHPIEMLYTLMGTGCEEVTRITSPDADVIVGRWSGGRIGTVRALRPYGGYGAVVFHPKQIVQSNPSMRQSYVPMLEQMTEFFKKGIVPVPNEETLELFAFMDAAQRSKEAGGQPMKLR